jgi:hypothetical protein
MSLQQVYANLRRTLMFAKRRCYQATFLPDGGSPDAERVLADLRRFCRADSTTFDPDPQMAAFKAGKREVWLRINYYLNLDDAAVHRLVEVESDYDDGE